MQRPLAQSIRAVMEARQEYDRAVKTDREDDVDRRHEVVDARFKLLEAQCTQARLSLDIRVEKLKSAILALPNIDSLEYARLLQILE